MPKTVRLPRSFAPLARAAPRAALALGLSGCAIPPADVHLAPLYSHHRLAAGGSVHEALGGVLELRQESGARPATEIAVHPLFRHRREADATETDVLWPLGHGTCDGEESWSRFFPLWWWRAHRNEEGRREVDWAFLPFLFGGSGDDDRERYFAIFPFGGVMRDFFGFAEIRFVLFPLFASTVKEPGNQRAYGILPPITGWGSGDDGSSWWRIWPLFGRSTFPGRYDRAFVLWPLWHDESNHLNTQTPSREWLLFPIYGETERGGFHARTALWPFFGWDWNDETGYSATDFLWPLVRVVRGGSGQPYEQTRVLPFYASTRSVEIDSTTYAWPIVWIREERTPGYDQSSFYVVPFFYTARSTRRAGPPGSAPSPDAAPGAASTDLVWPLYRQETRADGSADAEALWPIPFPKVRGFRENWYPFFSLFSRRESAGGAVSDRLFLDLFRRESRPQETRWSVPVFGGRRGTAEGGSEWSLLLGLLRWRTDSAGTRLLTPAFPGPGFEPPEAP